MPAGAVVSCGGASGYYGELMGIKGLNWLSKHFINREWAAAACVRGLRVAAGRWGTACRGEVFGISNAADWSKKDA